MAHTILQAKYDQISHEVKNFQRKIELEIKEIRSSLEEVGKQGPEPRKIFKK